MSQATLELEEKSEVVKRKPRPFRIDAPTSKVQMLETPPTGVQSKIEVTYEFVRLDRSNFKLLKDREKETVRQSDQIRRDTERPKYSEDKANKEFFRGSIKGATAKPYGDERAEPRVIPIERLRVLTQEKINRVVNKLLECKARVVKENLGDSDELAFLFEGEGTMDVELVIGDEQAPAYSLLIRYDRPPAHRRSSLREAFAHQEVKRDGDLQLKHTVIDLEAGISFHDEFIKEPLDDEEHSTIVFTVDETTRETRPATIEDIEEIKALLNPSFKVEISAAIRRHFEKGESD